MSINWVELNQHKQPLPIGDERFMSLPVGHLLEAKAKICSPIPCEPRSEGNMKNGTELETSGVAYLSNMRLVFVSSIVQPSPPWASFSTFSVLFSSILAVKYMQPWFGGNYIEVAFKPTPDGGLPIGAIATMQLRTDGRGLYEFCARFELSMKVARHKQLEASILLYTPPKNDATAPADQILDAPSELPPAYSI